MLNQNTRGQVIDSAADIYDRFFVPALFQQWPARLVRTAGVGPGQRVLDVACGTGVLARQLVECVQHPGLVSAVDINDGMLTVARERSPSIQWHHAPAESLPFKEHHFDAVLSQFGLMFFEDRVRALQEMYRVLRPRGQLVIAVWDRLDNTPGYHAVTRLLQKLFGNSIADEIRAPYALGDSNDLEALFASAGIDSISISTREGTARFPSIDDWIYTDIKGWTLADKLDNEQFERLLQEAGQALQIFADTAGTVSFPAPAHIISAIKHAM